MKYKTIIEALRGDNQLRISSGSKWLYFDEITKEWVVRGQGYRKKNSIELYRGESEMLAINILCE